MRRKNININNYFDISNSYNVCFDRIFNRDWYFGIWIFKYKPKKWEWNYKIFIIPIVVGVFGIFIIILVLQKLGTSSGNIRVEDFVIGYNIWRKYAIWGCGYENNDLIKTYFSISRTNMGFSNSLTQILVQCGLYIFVLYIYCFMKGIIQGIKNKM